MRGGEEVFFALLVAAVVAGCSGGEKWQNRRVLRGIQEESAAPASPYDRFPGENRIPDRRLFFPKGFLDLPGLVDVTTADYWTPDGEMRAFLTRFETEDAAAGAAAQLRQALGPDRVDREGFCFGSHGKKRRICYAVRGTFLVGAVNPPSLEAARAVLEKIDVEQYPRPIATDSPDRASRETDPPDRTRK
jgi:hypothetical protein